MRRYNRTDDAVFGAVVSGRPSVIDGVESMIGLFINTVPVRIKTGDESFRELLGRLQKEMLDSEAFSYHPLADIQSQTELKQDLIDHIIVFENYPIQQRDERRGKGIGCTIPDRECQRFGTIGLRF